MARLWWVGAAMPVAALVGSYETATLLAGHPSSCFILSYFRLEWPWWNASEPFERLASPRGFRLQCGGGTSSRVFSPPPTARVAAQGDEDSSFRLESLSPAEFALFREEWVVASRRTSPNVPSSMLHVLLSVPFRGSDGPSSQRDESNWSESMLLMSGICKLWTGPRVGSATWILTPLRAWSVPPSGGAGGIGTAPAQSVGSVAAAYWTAFSARGLEFLETATSDGASAREGEGQMYAKDVDPSLNQVATIMVYVMGKELVPEVIKTMQKDAPEAIMAGLKLDDPKGPVTNPLLFNYRTELANSLVGDAGVHAAATTLPKIQASIIASLCDALTEAVTTGVVSRVHRQTAGALVASLEPALGGILLERVGSILTHGLTVALTRSLTSVFVRSVSRSPISDYYCHYCKTGGMYCHSCAAAVQKDHSLDHTAQAYASYYADYFSRAYATGPTRAFAKTWQKDVASGGGTPAFGYLKGRRGCLYCTLVGG